MSKFQKMILSNDKLSEGLLDYITNKPIGERIKSANTDSDFISLHRHFHKQGKTDSSLNKKTPDSAYKKMVDSYTVSDRIIAAKHAPSHMLYPLSDDINPDVKVEVAKRTETFHPDMVSDNASVVRDAVAKASNNKVILSKLATDLDPRVAKRAVNRASEVLGKKDSDEITDMYNKRHPTGYDGEMFT